MSGMAGIYSGDCLTGIHYTSLSNWKRIQREGLIPQKIYKDEVIAYTGPVKGTYIYSSLPEGRNQVVALISALSRQRSSKLVSMTVEYTNDDVLKVGSRRLVIRELEESVGSYGTIHDRVLLLSKRIPPSQLKLIRIYDMEKILA